MIGLFDEVYDDGTRVLIVMMDREIQVWLEMLPKGLRIFGSVQVPDDGVAEQLHEHAGELLERGWDLGRWWHLWPCRDCAAIPLAPCWHLRTGAPLMRCHKGRRPRRHI